MYSKISVALIIVGLLVAGFGIFTSSTAQAAPPCVNHPSAALAANPESLNIICSQLSGKAQIDGQRAFEGGAVRYSGPVERYSGVKGTTDSSYLAANPELNAARRYSAISNNASSQPVTYDLEALRQYYAEEWTIEADTIDPSPLMQTAQGK